MVSLHRVWQLSPAMIMPLDREARWEICWWCTVREDRRPGRNKKTEKERKKKIKSIILTSWPRFSKAGNSPCPSYFCILHDYLLSPSLKQQSWSKQAYTQDRVSITAYSPGVYFSGGERTHAASLLEPSPLLRGWVSWRPQPIRKQQAVSRDTSEAQWGRGLGLESRPTWHKYWLEGRNDPLLRRKARLLSTQQQA